MKRPVFIVLISTLLLTACGLQSTTVPTPSPLPIPSDTPLPTLEPTSVPPTQVFQSIDIKSGGFSLSVHPDLEFDVDDTSITLSDTQGSFAVSLNGKAYIASEYTLESFLDLYVNEIASRGGAFIQSVPYEIEIDSMKGTAVNISGLFLDAPIAGKAFVVSPGKNFVVFGLGMSNLSANKNEWSDVGSDNFETLLASIKFKE